MARGIRGGNDTVDAGDGNDIFRIAVRWMPATVAAWAKTSWSSTAIT